MTSGLAFKLFSVIIEGADLIEVLLKQFPGLEAVIKQYADPSSLKMIGMGDKGTAFSDGNVVIKVTEDSQEADASANLVNVDIPGINKIHYVGKFQREIPYKDVHDDEPIQTQYFVIVQDLLDANLNSYEKEVIDLLGGFMSDNRVPWPFDINKMLNAIFNYGYVKSHKMYKSPKSTAILTRLLTAMLELHSKRHIELGDVSAQNVGKKDGDLVIFDLGLSKSPKVQIPVVESLAK